MHLKSAKGTFGDNITSLGVNIPIAGGFTVSREIPATSPSVALEKILKNNLSGIKRRKSGINSFIR